MFFVYLLARFCFSDSASLSPINSLSRLLSLIAASLIPLSSQIPLTHLFDTCDIFLRMREHELPLLHCSEAMFWETWPGPLKRNKLRSRPSMKQYAQLPPLYRQTVATTGTPTRGNANSDTKTPVRFVSFLRPCARDASYARGRDAFCMAGKEIPQGSVRVFSRVLGGRDGSQEKQECRATLLMRPSLRFSLKGDTFRARARKRSRN